MVKYKFRQPRTELFGALKVLLRSDFWYPIFLHFRLEYVVFSHHAKFQLITTTGSLFFGPF